VLDYGNEQFYPPPPGVRMDNIAYVLATRLASPFVLTIRTLFYSTISEFLSDVYEGRIKVMVDIAGTYRLPCIFSASYLVCVPPAANGWLLVESYAPDEGNPQIFHRSVTVLSIGHAVWFSGEGLFHGLLRCL